jgi:hypothetical protein
MPGRYAEVWTDALDAELEALEQHRVERAYRTMLALTDRVLGQLEQRNMDGQQKLDEVMRRDIARTLAGLTPRARSRFPRTSRVQEALDGIFDVQGELMIVLQRMVHWDRLLATGPWEVEDEADDRQPARRSA